MKNRTPTKPNRYAIYDEAHNFLRYEYHERADDPTDPGTPINKQTLLQDATANKLWPPALKPANPVVDGALERLAGGVLYNYETVPIDILETWKRAAIPFAINEGSACAYGAGKYVAINKGTSVAAYSADGITWEMTVMPASNNWSSIVYGNGKFVAVGGNVVAYSTNGVNWFLGSIPSNKYVYSVAYGNGKFVAISTDTSNCDTVYSTNGINWTEGTPFVNNWKRNLAFGSGKFLAIGSWGGDSSYEYSTDCITWAKGTLPVSASWEGLSFGAGKFVATCRGNAAYSSDGVNWSLCVVPTSFYAPLITFYNGVFLGCRKDSIVTDNFVSKDGITWVVKSAPGEIVTCLAGGPDRFIALVGEKARVLYSEKTFKTVSELSAFNGTPISIPGSQLDGGAGALLRTVTVQTAANQVDIDVTDIDWYKWKRVILECDLKGNSSRIFVSIHNDTVGQYYYQWGYMNKTDYRIGEFDRSTTPCNGKGVIVFEPYHDPNRFVQCQTLTSCTTYYGCGYRRTYGDMNTVNFVIADTSVAENKIGVGSKIEIWGEY